MNARVLVVVLATVVGALAAGGIGSCSSTIPAPPTGIDEPPTLRISSPFDGACIEVPNTPDAFVPVTVDVAGSFYLRPPGTACANVYNCGYLNLYVDRAFNNMSAAATVNAMLGGESYGMHTLTVELVWDFNDGGGQDMFDANMTYDGAQTPDVNIPPAPGTSVADPGPTGYYQASVTIRTAASCSDSGTGVGGSGAGGGGAGGSKPDGGSGSGGDAGADGGDGGGAGGAPPSDAGGTGGTPPSDGGGTGGAPPNDGGGTGGGAPTDAGIG